MTSELFAEIMMSELFVEFVISELFVEIIISELFVEIMIDELFLETMISELYVEIVISELLMEIVISELFVEIVISELFVKIVISEIKIMPGFSHSYDYYYKRKGDIYNKTVVWFAAQSDTDLVKISHEHIDFVWLSYDDAFKKLTFDNAKTLLKKAHEFIENMT